MNLSPEGRIRYSPKFPWVIPNRKARSHALLTRLPLSTTRRWLHVRLACVRPAASVRSEPGSNSHVENRILNCPWMESSKGSLRFDEFPTSMSDATPSKRSARNTPIGLRKRKTVRVSLPATLRGPARKDSAVCVSLSSYHNVKEPSGVRLGAPLPNL